MKQKPELLIDCFTAPAWWGAHIRRVPILGTLTLSLEPGAPMSDLHFVHPSPNFTRTVVMSAKVDLTLALMHSTVELKQLI